MSRVPIVVILGATGTGKSKLAIQIAKKFNGEIISADSMQVYEGLDIASNKVTRAERAEVPHHMLDICKPTDQFTVLNFRNRTLSIIEEITKYRKMPIIVGGTNYYIESILWNTLLKPPEPENELTKFEKLCKPKKLKTWQTLKKTHNSKCMADSNELKEVLITETVNSSNNDSNTLTVHYVDTLINEIDRVKNDFHNSIDYIATQLRISPDLYSRTFYPAMEEQLTTFWQQSFVQSLDNGSINIDIVAIETSIMDMFICQCFEKVMSSLYSCFSDIGEKYHYDCNTLPKFDQFSKSGAVFSIVEKDKNSGAIEDVTYMTTRLRQFLNRMQRKEQIFFSVPTVLEIILQRIGRVAKMREKRLKLTQVVEDIDLSEFTSEELHSELKLIDLSSAKNLHPNNRRRIIRALQVFMQTGKTLTELLDEQHQTYGSSTCDISLRFPDALLLWLRCDQDVLNKRLSERVDEMVNEGLIAELEKFHESHNASRLTTNEPEDYTKGIFQSIGLKEFHQYLMLTDEEKRSDFGGKQKDRAVQLLKQANIQYAKKQERFLINKLVKVPDTKQVPLLFQLDSTELEKWHELVESKALALVNLYVKNEVDMQSLSPVNRQSADLNRFDKGEYFCDVCYRLFIGRYQWHAHYTSKSHRRRLYNFKVKELQKKIAALGRPTKKIYNNEEDCDDSDVDYLDDVAGIFSYQ